MYLQTEKIGYNILNIKRSVIYKIFGGIAMSKNIMKKLLIGTLLAFGLTACGGGEKKDAAKLDPNQKVTIKYWSFPNFTSDSEYKTPEEYDKALIKAFEEKNPNIKVEYQKIEFTDGPAKIETAIQAKSNPDVVIDAPGRVIAWAKNGVLAPFNDIDTSKYSKEILSASSFDNKVYLYPLGTAPFVMAVNKKLTDKMGITDLLPLNKPGRNWTVEEFEKFLKAAKAKDPSIDPVLFYTKSQAGDQGPRAFVSNLYNSWITDNGVTKYTINDENGVKSLTWIKKAYDEELLGKGVSAEAKDALEAFRTGKALVTILYSPGLKGQDKEAIEKGDVEPIFLPFPNESGQAKFEFLLAGAAVFDNGDPAKVAAAQKFVDFIVNDPVWGERSLKATNNFSPTGKTGIYGDDAEVKYLESLVGFYGPYYNTVDGFIQMRPLWFNMVQSVLNGQVQPKDGLDKFVTDANKTIQDAK